MNNVQRIATAIGAVLMVASIMVTPSPMRAQTAHYTGFIGVAPETSAETPQEQVRDMTF